MDVELTYNLSGAAKVVDGTVQGKSVGRTTLKIGAGDASAAVPIEVIEKLFSDNLVLSDGESSTRTLNAGTYEVEAHVSSGDSTYGITAEWVGAACAKHTESQHVVTRCHISNTGSLVLENPTSFGIGPTAKGNVTIYKVPPDE